MTKGNTIPTLTRDAYKKSYFTQEHNGKAIADAESFNHFEINRRCLWRNTIPAHRLDFYMVFLATEGEGIHTFGAHEHYIKKNMLCFVGPNMVSTWQSDDDVHQGFFCTFSDDFFNLGRANKNFLNELPFFQPDGAAAVLHLTDAQTQYYLSLFTLMQEEYDQRSEYSHQVLSSELQALLYRAHAQYRTGACPPYTVNNPGIRLLKAFTACYMRDFNSLSQNGVTQLKSISAYAEELGVSQNHLNDTIKAVTGRSAGQLIKTQLIRQATVCIKHSGKSISEIAYALGYDDPSYFARYYKSQTGRSPSEVRQAPVEST